MASIASSAAHIHVIRVLDLPAQLDVVVRKLANLDVVDAEDLFFFGGAELERWNPLAEEVEESEDNAGHEEGVEAAGDGIGQLVAHLDPVVVEPAAGEVGEAVEVSNVVTISK